MENLIRVKIAPRPLFSTRSSFPYEAVIESLKVLDNTKSIIFSNKECTQANLTYLRVQCKKLGLGDVKIARKDENIYLWLNK